MRHPPQLVFLPYLRVTPVRVRRRYPWDGNPLLYFSSSRNLINLRHPSGSSYTCFPRVTRTVNSQRYRSFPSSVRRPNSYSSLLYLDLLNLLRKLSKPSRPFLSLCLYRFRSCFLVSSGKFLVNPLETLTNVRFS